MTDNDPDDIGDDGRVRLRCYLPQADSLLLSAGCQGRQGCGHSAPIGVRAAIHIMGLGEATVGELNHVHFETRSPGHLGRAHHGGSPSFCLRNQATAVGSC